MRRAGEENSKAPGLCWGCSMPWSRTARNRSGCWPPNSASRSASSTPTSSAASRRAWSRSAGAGAALRLLSHAAGLRRKVAADRRISFVFVRIFPSGQDRLLGIVPAAKARGVDNVLLVGQSDLAEIAALCAHGAWHQDRRRGAERSAAKTGSSASRSLKISRRCQSQFDAVLITDMTKSRETCEAAVARFGAERVSSFPNCCACGCGRRARSA